MPVANVLIFKCLRAHTSLRINPVENRNLQRANVVLAVSVQVPFRPKFQRFCALPRAVIRERRLPKVAGRSRNSNCGNMWTITLMTATCCALRASRNQYIDAGKPLHKTGARKFGELVELSLSSQRIQKPYSLNPTRIQSLIVPDGTKFRNGNYICACMRGSESKLF